MNGFLKSIKDTRSQANLTQKEVESMLSLRPLSIRDYESGRLKLPVGVAIRMAELYGVSMAELIGENKTAIQSKALNSFNALFHGHPFHTITMDPIIRAYLEDNYEKFFDHSLFELLTEHLSQREQEQLITTLAKLLLSLAGADEKASDEEIECIKKLLASLNLQHQFSHLSEHLSKKFSFATMPSYLEKIEMRHFLIWTLFIFAYSDKVVCKEEFQYLEQIAFELKINRTNFLYIKKIFVKEK